MTYMRKKKQTQNAIHYRHFFLPKVVHGGVAIFLIRRLHSRKIPTFQSDDSDNFSVAKCWLFSQTTFQSWWTCWLFSQTTFQSWILDFSVIVCTYIYTQFIYIYTYLRIKLIKCYVTSRVMSYSLLLYVYEYIKTQLIYIEPYI